MASSVEKCIKIGAATMYQGNAINILPECPIVDGVITDPPFSINTKSALPGKLSPWPDLINAAFWYAGWYKLVRDRLGNSGYFWTFLSWRTLTTVQKAAFDNQWSIESLLVWDKEWIGPGGTIGLRPSYEMIALLSVGDFTIADRGVPDIKRCKWSSHKPNGHPAEKPQRLIEWLASISGGGTILDPFMGSGTVGAACMALGIPFIGIEMEERWFDVACIRIKEAEKQQALIRP